VIGFALLSCCALPQWPTDARELLQWHAACEAEDRAAAPDATVLRNRLYAYQAAGAESEAWAAARALDRLAPADPDGDRYRVQLCVWDPERWAEGLQLADRWLQQETGRPAQEIEAVAAARSLLAQRLAAREATASRQSARGWVIGLALVVLAGGGALALRSAR